ncbi:hypothetical protein VCRA2116O29_410022 [Vibrio crassostreae]|nr:hypothetical protein VCRA2116O29_410022 [Vibrio crassostreae]CAK3798786.1 hypothetical protein VCRA2123O74_370006 [Vibrio crassostreae]
MLASYRWTKPVIFTLFEALAFKEHSKAPHGYIYIGMRRFNYLDTF